MQYAAEAIVLQYEQKQNFSIDEAQKLPLKD